MIREPSAQPEPTFKYSSLPVIDITDAGLRRLAMHTAVRWHRYDPGGGEGV